MASNMEKLSGFYSAINHYADAQREQILKDIAAFKEKSLKEVEEAAQIEAGRMVKKEVAEARGEITRVASHKEIEARRVLLEKRQNIADKVFEKAAEALVAYTAKPEYTKTLMGYASEMAKVLTQPGTVVYHKYGDVKAMEAATAAFGRNATTKVDDNIKIGGIRAENAAMRMILDDTLDAMLEAQRSWFEENSGLVVV